MLPDWVLGFVIGANLAFTLSNFGHHEVSWLTYASLITAIWCVAALLARKAA